MGGNVVDIILGQVNFLNTPLPSTYVTFLDLGIDMLIQYNNDKVKVPLWWWYS